MSQKLMGHTIGRKNWMLYLLAIFAFISLSMGVAAVSEAQQLPAGMIAYWKFNECAGTTAADAVNANSGTLVNGPVWTSGKIDCALSFDGVSTYVNVAPSSTLNVTNQLTIEAWINMAAQAGGPQHYIVDSRDGSSTGGYGLNVDTELIQFWIGQRWPDFSVSITTGAWHHVVGTYDGTTMVVYVDGTSVGSAPFSAVSSPSTAPLFIGQRYTSSEIFNGLMDEVAIYNRALSPADVQQRYQNGSGSLPLPV
jgi:hypothetical protein